MTTKQELWTSVLLSAVISAITSGLVTGLVLLREPLRQPTPQNNAAAQSIQQPAVSTGNNNPITLTVQRADPAVVSVIISKNMPVMQQYSQTVPFGQDFFGSPFSIQMPQLRQNGTQNQEIGGGTAFFVSSDGLLLTNKHVVEDPQAQYTVYLNDGRKLQATVVARDPTNDIALLKVQGSNFPYLTLSNAQPVLGQSVIAIGNALAQFRNTVSVGVVSGLQRSIQAGGLLTGDTENLSRIIQTDAAINEGNSGGPLLDTQGNVIGMNTAVAGNAQGIAFAIPASDLQVTLQSYLKNGRIVRPYLGLRYVPVTPDLQTQDHLSYDYGVMAIAGQNGEPAILPGSPADKAGLRENDIILEVDGQKLEGDVLLADIISHHQPGDILTLKVAHGSQMRTVTVKVEEWKQA